MENLLTNTSVPERRRHLNPLHQRMVALVTDKARKANGLHFVKLGSGWTFTALRRGRGPFARVSWRIENPFRILIASGER